MKTKIFTIVALFCAVIFSSCSKENDEPILDEPTEPPYENTIDKIAGVWESSENDLIFISISTHGKISYCLNQYVMGHGDAKLSDESLIIDNVYSGYTDKLDVEFDNNNLSLKGNIIRKFTAKTDEIQLTLKKVNEKNIYSLIGEFWKPLSGLSPTHGNVQSTLGFVGDNTAQYKYYVVRTGKIIREAVWYYIPRKHHERGDIAYVHKSDEVTPLIQVCDWWVNDDLFERK